jgi:nickel-dependent lactate racemase
MDVELKYGPGSKRVTIPDKARIMMLKPGTQPVLPSVEDALHEGLDRLIPGGRFEELLHSMRPKSVAIAVPDESRPLPVKTILPVLLQRIRDALPNLEPASCVVIIGCGLHPPPDKEAMSRLIPQWAAPGCRLLAHDASRTPTEDYGKTSRGTPILINAAYAEADFKISIGQIDPHQFVGFTGGSKGVVIGCAGSRTIEHNHSLLFDDKARVGRLEGNPVREDMNEAGEKVDLNLAVNVVLDGDKKVLQMLAGRPSEVLEEGAKTCAALYGVEIREKCDMVVASCGGYPKDLCLYQAQKGLNLASQAVKRGGKILLLAAASQGAGDDVYLEYVSRFNTPSEVLEDFRRTGFRMGAHKAYLFGRTLTRYEVAVDSELDDEILKTCQLGKADPERVIRSWVEGFEGTPLVGVIPNANTTYFYSLNEGLGE